jgi:hypothetical protein
LFSNKSTIWEYETEHRLIVDLTGRPGQHKFLKLPSESLVSITIGACSKISREWMSKFVVRRGWQPVEVQKLQLHAKEYRLVVER